MAAVSLVAGCGGPGLSGSAAVVQDVEGLGEQPIEAGWVVAVPEASAGALLAAAPSDGELPYATWPLSREQVTAAGGAVAEVDDGRFRLDAGAGPHLLCLVQDSGTAERARGCGAVDLPSTGELEVTTGEAGFRVAVRS